jgi:hypothetical protein
MSAERTHKAFASYPTAARHAAILTHERVMAGHGVLQSKLDSPAYAAYRQYLTPNKCAACISYPPAGRGVEHCALSGAMVRGSTSGRPCFKAR